MSPAERFERFAAELSRNLHAVGVLLDEHPAAGRCTGCPSARMPVAAPCSLRHVATAALAIRAETERRALAAAVTEPLPVVAGVAS